MKALKQCTIGDNIKRYRKNSKMTQTELANKLNKSLRTIQKYEANDIIPSAQIIKQIASVLNIETSLLSSKEDNNIYLDKEELQVIYKLLCIVTSNFGDEKEINLKAKIEKALHEGDIGQWE